MPTSMRFYNDIAKRYGVNPYDAKAVERWFTEELQKLSEEDRRAIFEELLSHDDD